MPPVLTSLASVEDHPLGRAVEDQDELVLDRDRTGRSGRSRKRNVIEGELNDPGRDRCVGREDRSEPDLEG